MDFEPIIKWMIFDIIVFIFFVIAFFYYLYFIYWLFGIFIASIKKNKNKIKNIPEFDYHPALIILALVDD